jgi:hypothetical protein
MLQISGQVAKYRLDVYRFTNNATLFVVVIGPNGKSRKTGCCHSELWRCSEIWSMETWTKNFPNDIIKEISQFRLLWQSTLLPIKKTSLLDLRLSRASERRTSEY